MLSFAICSKAKLCKPRFACYFTAMSTVKEIAAAIPKLSHAEVEELRAWLESYSQCRQKTDTGKTTNRRSVLHLRSLPGKWIGEPVFKSGDLADEMCARA